MSPEGPLRSGGHGVAVETGRERRLSGSVLDLRQTTVRSPRPSAAPSPNILRRRSLPGAADDRRRCHPAAEDESMRVASAIIEDEARPPYAPSASRPVS